MCLWHELVWWVRNTKMAETETIWKVKCKEQKDNCNVTVKVTASELSEAKGNVLVDVSISMQENRLWLRQFCSLCARLNVRSDAFCFGLPLRDMKIRWNQLVSIDTGCSELVPGSVCDMIRWITLCPLIQGFRSLCLDLCVTWKFFEINLCLLIQGVRYSCLDLCVTKKFVESPCANLYRVFGARAWICVWRCRLTSRDSLNCPPLPPRDPVPRCTVKKRHPGLYSLS
jgi:hypothetical protein